MAEPGICTGPGPQLHLLVFGFRGPDPGQRHLPVFRVEKLYQ